MKRTYIVFENSEKRESAFDFLTHTNLKYKANVCNDKNKPCWISFSPKAFVKNCIDLYLNGIYANSFTKLY